MELVSYLGDPGTPADPVWSLGEETRAGIPGRPCMAVGPGTML